VTGETVYVESQIIRIFLVDKKCVSWSNWWVKSV